MQLIPEGDAPTAVAVEQRIHSLRQLYATTFLVNAGRSEELGRALTSNPNADLESLLNEKDRLYISAASEGTFWLTVLTKTKVAFRSLTTIVPLFYVEGRQALLDRMRANTALKKIAVQKAERRARYQCPASPALLLPLDVDDLKSKNTKFPCESAKRTFRVRNRSCQASRSAATFSRTMAT